MLKAENLSKIYRTDTVLTTVFDNLSFEVETGEFVAITGPSGAGKTTLLNTLGLLENFQKGNLYINDQNVASLSDKALSTLRNTHIGFVFQNFNLLPELSVLDNVSLPLEIAGIAKAKANQEAKQQLEYMGLLGRCHHKPNQLSGGQQQRVAIARALVSAPQLILADEPTGNLNSAMAQEIMLLLKRINDEGTTIIMVTHDDVLAKMASRTIELMDGKILNANEKGFVECA
ncbi:ABC transporter ATP-binding protein [Pseudoalteromonas xiamenensis]|uniref:ABC transporter ATP-binding protein n=1 Tax=Pseudoalteromonas xiamenensis TaxID=882626 RepID=UPI0027E5A3DC|nr:ABC transporter ATP-binding protein [Pseudoalteromonas xiamenensis]WMN60570.1 ABC transporter ATP-binding protein [Pseudoalteromonas xiamenensis]